VSNNSHPVTYGEALIEALQEEMRRDPAIFLMGYYLPKSIFFVPADSLLQEFGSSRCVLTPVSEAGIVGSAVGAAMAGLRPVVDLRLSSFAWYATDQFVNQAARNRYLSGGQVSVPAVFVMNVSPGSRAGAQHSDRSYPLFMHIPGFNVLAPSTPYDAKGLLKAALRQDNPVILYLDNAPGPRYGGRRQEIPNGDYTVPIGRAIVHRQGSDVTVVPICWLHRTMEVVDKLAQEGISCEVVEPRTLKPLDIDCILKSVAKTGRLVVVDISHPCCGAAAEVAASIADEGFGYLKAPVTRVTTPDIHIPAAPALEDEVWPTPDRIAAAIRQSVGYRR